MTRVGVVVVALLLAVAWPGAVRAQDAAAGGMLGLPLVPQENGWARYATETEAGPTEVVIRLGSADRHKGRQGRWILIEVHMPEVGRVGIHFLVAGERFLASNILKARVVVPSQPAQESDEPLDTVSAVFSKPRLVKKGKERVAGRLLEVSEFAFEGGVTASWSPSVPPLGLTRVGGTQPLQLLAFGVGGDPWKGAQQAPVWPTDRPEPKKAP